MTLIKNAMSTLKDQLLTVPKLSNVIEIPNDKEKKIVLFEETAL